MPPKKQKSPKTNDKVDVNVSTATDEASNRYKRISHTEHVLLRPEMYIGSMEHHLLLKVPLLKPDVQPVLLPKLMKAGPDFDTAFVQLNGGPSVSLKKFSEEEPKFDDEIHPDGEITHSNDELDNKTDEKELDDELLQTTGNTTIIDDGSSSFEEEDGESVPVINGKILGVDARLCDTSGKFNAERIIGPGSFYYKDVWLNPGLLKIFDEVIMNAADNRLASPNDGATRQTFIKVSFDQQTGRITVANDGNGIPIVKHKDHNLWIPEMIFGHLLTSSHYENDPESVAAGRHGYGAKLTNIMSSEFTVTCHWKDKVFVGKWSENMSKSYIDVKESLGVSSFKTEVSFVPDYDRFFKENMETTVGFDGKREFIEIIRKRCLDLAASIGTKQKVFFNDICLTPGCFGNYCRMYFSKEEKDRQPFIIEKRNVKLGILLRDPATVKNANIGTEGDTPHISLVNGVSTPQGGVHLEYAEKMVSNTLVFVGETLRERGRVIFDIESFRKNLTIFISVIVSQPKFDSQSKQKLVSKHTFLSIHQNMALANHILNLPFLSYYCVSADAVDREFLDTILSGRQASNKLGLVNIPKLVEPSRILDPTVEKTLILTEGDSASTLAISSMSLEQRTTFGVFPLRGKILNVRAHSLRMLADNEELMNLFIAIGLRLNDEAPSVSSLRYQRIMIMTDQDPDGIHIRGLLLNLFDVLWPTLVEKNPGFISIFSTPIVKVTLPSEKEHRFYSTKQYDEWVTTCDSNTLSTIKRRYYKGLGTSTTEEGKIYFSNIDSTTTKIIWNNNSGQSLVDFFDPFMVAKRKEMVFNFVDSEQTCENASATITEFVNNDLISFVSYVNHRQLPSLTDGLKTSNRKVLWALLKRDPPAMRVSQLAGHVSEVSNYHHGEVSLHGVIVKMAQDFTTSNNINLLVPEGQFGSRICGGADSAAPRYIFTKLSRFARLLFPKIDDSLLEYHCVDGDFVEPVSYSPIIPLAIINGVRSIGYGMSCSIPSHHPVSVIHCTKRLLNGEPASEVYQPNSLSLIPVGYRGSVKQLQKGIFVYTGKVDIYDGEATRSSTNPLFPKQLILRVTELPPSMTPSCFITYISKKFGRHLVKKNDVCSGDHIDIELHVDTNFLISKMSDPTEESLIMVLGLYSAIPKVYGYLLSGCSQNKFVDASVVTIAEEHFRMRFSIYEKRHAALLKSYKREIKRLDSTIRFTELVTNDLSLFRLSEEKLSQRLRDEGIYEADGVDDEEVVNKNDNSASERVTSNGYNYLIKKPLSSLLKTNVDSLKERYKASQERLAEFEKNVTVKDLWLKDLNALETEFLRYEKKKNAAISERLSLKSMKNIPLGEAFTDKDLPILQTLPSYCPEKNSITNIFDVFRYEMEKQGWHENYKWARKVAVLNERAIKERRENMARIYDANKAVKAALVAQHYARILERRASKESNRIELQEIKETIANKKQMLEDLKAKRHKILESCSVDSNSGIYILTDSDRALLDEIILQRAQILSKVFKEDPLIDNEVKNAAGVEFVVDAAGIEDHISDQPTKEIPTCENMLQDDGVSEILNESRRIDSFINKEVDASSKKEIHESTNVTGVELIVNEKRGVVKTTSLKNKQRPIRTLKTNLVGNRAVKTNKLVANGAERKVKKSDKMKQKSIHKRAPRAEPPKKGIQKQVQKPSNKSNKAGRIGNKVPEVPHSRIRRVVRKKITHMEVVRGQHATPLVSKHPDPLTAPFSTMTAPLSIAIHPADTFVLMHAAMAHRAFAARQHMTALAVRRVGAIGVPVLGRLLSRFVF